MVHLADRVLAWLAASGPVAPLLVFAFVFAESGLLLFVPGETAVVAGGVLSASGALPLSHALAAAVGGAVLGDGAGYYWGRGPGRRRFAAKGHFLLLHERQVRRVEEILARWGVPAVLGARFFPLARVAGPFVFGLTGLPPRRFFPWMAIADVVWGIAYTLLGWLLADAWEDLHPWLTHVRWLAILSILAAAGAWLLWRRRR